VRLLHEVRGFELRLFGIANPRRKRRDEDLVRDNERERSDEKNYSGPLH